MRVIGQQRRRNFELQIQRHDPLVAPTSQIMTLA
jgi:hypothetical protein